MINYGIVYPQAILVFVITLLYSVIQPLILVFGAVYFGVAYVVYKYKLLFGMYLSSDPSLLMIDRPPAWYSVLQTLRIARAGLANHIHAAHLGNRHLPGFHDGSLYT